MASTRSSILVTTYDITIDIVVKGLRELRRFLLGWQAYFCTKDLAIKRAELKTLDAWIRRRLRAHILRSWRWGQVMYRELLRRGVDSWLVTVVARRAKSYWRNSQASAVQFSFPNTFFDERGLPRLST